jgi:succinate-semialdehyde dehydrogenase/glutarate-semialdehyde dehydrogenase
MNHRSVDPATGAELHREPAWDAAALAHVLAAAARARAAWQAEGVTARAARIATLAGVLRDQAHELAALATLEMGKLPAEALAEVEKSAWGCDYYAAEAGAVLADQPVATDAGRSLVVHAPLGTVLAVMPWNFPYWQAIRAAVPALAAGNTVILKHAPGVPQCARAIEACFLAAGFPPGVYQNAFLDEAQVAEALADPRVHGVTLTGSERAGRAVGELAGRHLKKAVLELGGSDPFVVLDDADLDLAVSQAVKARFQNCGQSCIAAKRFILTPGIADAFAMRFTAAAAALRAGDPRDPATTLAPLARVDLRDALHAQVEDARAHGARVLTGGVLPSGPGAFYPATVLDGVTERMRAWHEELFGPVATLVRVRDEADALRVANATAFGLGGSVWTRDRARGEAFARRLECGMAFVDGMVKSDPRLPFGGVKHSGHGRELAHHGLREFVNVQTLWIA